MPAKGWESGTGRIPPPLAPRGRKIAMSDLAQRLALTVNGEGRDLPAGSSVAYLLAEIGLAARKVAVERNLEIVPRSQYARTLLADGDAIEIVHFIGGG
jgi:sulfur carrier protein